MYDGKNSDIKCKIGLQDLNSTLNQIWLIAETCSIKVQVQEELRRLTSTSVHAKLRQINLPASNHLATEN